VNRIIGKINSLYLEARVRSYKKLSLVSPFNKLDQATIAKNKTLLEPYYNRYIKEVSVANMAASLELSASLLSMCQAANYKKLVDLGSGFTSFVLRYYAKSHRDVEVYSVDDSKEWLEKTGEYLRTSDVGVERLMTFEDFINGKFSNFECIVHDLNFVEERIKHVTRLLSLLSSKGILILDDMHKPDYRHQVLHKLKTEPFDVYELRELTIDSFGRYAMIASRK
jgi:hypothetical protein